MSTLTNKSLLRRELTLHNFLLVQCITRAPTNGQQRRSTVDDLASGWSTMLRGFLRTAVKKSGNDYSRNVRNQSTAIGSWGEGGGGDSQNPTAATNSSDLFQSIRVGPRIHLLLWALIPLLYSSPWFYDAMFHVASTSQKEAYRFTTQLRSMTRVLEVWVLSHLLSLLGVGGMLDDSPVCVWNW